METLNPWRALHGYVVFFLMINEGSSCEPPSSPLCFRRNSLETVYICEWNQTGRQSNVTYDLHFRFPSVKTFKNINRTWVVMLEEQLITDRPVEVWVEAHVGNSSCTSPNRSAELRQAVKFEAPGNITMSWMQNDLTLKWPAAEKFPALAEVLFGRHENHTDTREKRTINTTTVASKYQAIVVNLRKNSSYQVQIRHQSTQVRDPLWSNWSQVVFVPAELEHKLNVTWKARLTNGTRKVVLSWESVPRAASDSRITFILNDTQSSHGCPCKTKRVHSTTSTKYTIYVSSAAVNISLIARNAVGDSPTASVRIPAVRLTDLKVCDKTLLEDKLKKTMCLEWYELDADSMPTNGSAIHGWKNRNKNAQIKKSMQNHTRYLYFEQRCHNGKPQTVKMCLFYQKEGAPDKEPRGFMAFSETHTSVNLSWEAIPFANQRGFLTHYNLCSVKSNSQDEPRECHNISASEIKYRLENLTPGTKYSISLAGATRAGEGPQATVTVNTKPEKPVNLWLSFGLLILFFFFSIMCTVVLKRIKSKIFPPVPRPFIPNFTSHQLETQEMTEHKEEVHDLTLLRLHPEGRTVCEEAEEVTALRGQWEDGVHSDMEDDRSDSGGSDDESLSAGSTHDTLKTTTEGEVTDNELAILIYRNGLVFDVKTDSS